jgi:hypothetical protein
MGAARWGPHELHELHEHMVARVTGLEVGDRPNASGGRGDSAVLAGFFVSGS